MSDLLVNLYQLKKGYDEEELLNRGIVVKRAMIPDKNKILAFIREHYNDGWANECEFSLFNTPISCFIAVKEKEIIGFSCYDATARGFFGPIGISPKLKGGGIGQALLFRTLEAMKEEGYGYAIIGWVGNAIGFYEKCLDVFEIPDSEPNQGIYKRLIQMDESCL